MSRAIHVEWWGGPHDGAVFDLPTDQLLTVTCYEPVDGGYEIVERAIPIEHASGGRMIVRWPKGAVAA